ncbi:glycoside hydrolase family 5 protein [Stutzerimonas zhaodongensis]|jgi:endoglucanase|uniref:Glycoside hydrolase family 5 protein n=1 Tax=Stutzerimonas zhaodongensis TaxID=1176257 RepID=A0A365PYX9_9GAMM|nr:glycoside hydrolase family 5 protein [Stutzerimonas zhaodongensis]QWV19097.1 glycoside hydrolase family 5 protein [Stutzerimonas zhaodongensis]RBA62066.1 glycoside hydrolase family 5 protein [Stutzerimonas zhaodongensis]
MLVKATVSTRNVLLGAALFAATLSMISPIQTAHAAAASTASALQTVATAKVNDFTGPQWLKGSWRQSAGLSIPATAANKAAFKKGAQVRTADGQVRTVKVVYFSGAHMSVMLSGATLNASKNGHPKSVSALGTSAAAGSAVTAPSNNVAADTSSHRSAINNYTNNDWLNGVWRRSAGFSIPASSANRSAFKVGSSVKLADGQVRKINAVYVSGKNMSLMLSGATLSGKLGYPNKLFSATGSSAPASPVAPSKPAAPAPEPVVSQPAAGSSMTTALNAFNGGDFVNGVYNTSKFVGISVKATAANKAAFHKGAKIRFFGGQVRTIKLIYHSGGNMTVMVDGGPIDGKAVGYPRTISVSSTGFSNTSPSAGSTAPAAGGAAPAHPINLVGINLAGAEFGADVALPGVYLKQYIYPGEADFKRYAERNLKLVRLPFRWERIQPRLNGELNSVELGRMLATLDHAKKYNMQVILDMHNYYRYHGKMIGSNEVPVSAFADAWRRIAQKVANHPAVYGYGLMNEPHTTNGKWPAAALAAAKSIRTLDADNWVVIAGDRWSSAFHWPSYNTQLVKDSWMRDPNNNLMFEAHLYFDKDYSGYYTNRYEKYDPMIGVVRARPFVEWLTRYRLRGFIGEHGAPDFSPSAVVAMDNLLQYLGQHCIPSTYWAAGPWWGDYALSLDVKSGKPRPQLPILQKHAANKSCGAVGPLR